MVGTPDRRTATAREIEGLIGFFVNTLVLRADLAGDPTFARAAGPGARGGAGRLRAPGRAVRAAGRGAGSRSATSSRTPLFQVMFVAAERAGRGARRCRACALARRGRRSGRPPSSTSLLAARRARTAAARAPSSTAPTSSTPPTVERLLGHFATPARRGRCATRTRGSATLPLLDRGRARSSCWWSGTTPAPRLRAALPSTSSSRRRRRATPGRRRSRFEGEDADLRASWTRGPTAWPATCARSGVGPGGAGGALPGALARAGGGAAGHPQGGRRLRAARPGLPGGAAGLHAGGRRAPAVLVTQEPLLDGLPVGGRARRSILGRGWSELAAGARGRGRRGGRGRRTWPT